MTTEAIGQRYVAVSDTIAEAARAANRAASDVALVAVTKTHGAEQIRPVLRAGHRTFGENRVQEAAGKWPELREEFADIELHLIGPLQSNKAAEAVALFDVIESVDRDKIARALAREMEKQGKSPSCYVQVNTGLEPQKAGVAPEDLERFLALCRDELKLDIVGLMCIPPVDDDPVRHFTMLAGLAADNGLSKLSMGMSGDYATAIECGATSVRVGSAIFGAR